MLQVWSFYWSEMQQILSVFQITSNLCLPLVKIQPPNWRLSCPAPRNIKLQRVGGRPTRRCQPPAPPPCHKVATKTTKTITSPAISFLWHLQQWVWSAKVDRVFLKVPTTSAGPLSSAGIPCIELSKHFPEIEIWVKSKRVLLLTYLFHLHHLLPFCPCGIFAVVSWTREGSGIISYHISLCRPLLLAASRRSILRKRLEQHQWKSYSVTCLKVKVSLWQSSTCCFLWSSSSSYILCHKMQMRISNQL